MQNRGPFFPVQPCRGGFAGIMHRYEKRCTKRTGEVAAARRAQGLSGGASCCLLK